jgi:FkbM family methyltransferase
MPPIIDVLALYRRLPRPVRATIGRVRNYVGRLTRWAAVMHEIRGHEARDRRVLWRSAALSPITSLRDLDQWQDPVLCRDATVSVPGFGLFHIRAHSDDLYHVLPARERNAFQAVADILRPGDVFIDAGANIGIYTVLASSLVGPEGHVIAIEMMPDTCEILRAHVRLNQCRNVAIHNRALHCEEGASVDAFVTKNHYGQASIVIAAASSLTVPVKTVTLGSLIGDNRIRLLKLDLEGAELLALRGAGDALTGIDAIVYEDLGESGVGEFLMQRGFSIAKLDGRNFLASSERGQRVSDTGTAADFARSGIGSAVIASYKVVGE